ncbi:N-acyl-D-amino-acid deacylase family protein [Sphingosinicella terrae]|uniref:N-acyl-D-amino-acid deacylase family protein n=1 Tax=Sphingosinicella terrae TaxID=2172047 RepID=UPI000E0D4E4F|nr:amidohydrolase family protein [Sphingosinicella terrae]
MDDRLTRRQMIAGALAGGGLASLAAPAGAQGGRSTLFRDVLLVDGTGAPARPANVLVTGDRIARVAAPSRERVPSGTRVVEGGGRVLAPGFIDLHTHGDPLRSRYDGFLAMGVTTVTLGVDGSGPGTSEDLDTAAWRRAVGRAPLDTNVALLVGHGTIRHAAGISDSVRRPDAAQLQRLAAQLEGEFRSGVFGLSYGLEYVPGIYSEGAEHRVLGEVVARHGGVIMSHMRSEDDEAIEASIDELVASAGGARVHISHLKVVFGRGEARARALLDFLAAKRRQGIDLTADEYPYEAGFTGIAILFPEWALPPTDYAAIVRERRAELYEYLDRRMTRRGGPSALLIGTGTHAGKTLAQIAEEAGRHHVDVLIDMGPEGAMGAHFTMDKALQDALLVDRHVAFSTDGGPGQRHPRGAGTYAMLIEDYVVRDRKLTIEEMVRKATSYPARILRLADRGTIRPGAKADLVLFDPARVRARATYVDPFARAEGFDLVMVNGREAYSEGSKVGREGALLRAR